MNLTAKTISVSDYHDILVPWWNAWNFPPPVLDILPNADEGLSGFIFYSDETPLCAGFFYLTNSGIGWVEWIVSTPERHPLRKEAISQLVSLLTETLKESGCRYSYATMKHQGLMRTYEENGYMRGELDTIEMIKIL